MPQFGPCRVAGLRWVFIYGALRSVRPPQAPWPVKRGVAPLPRVKKMIYENGSKILQLAGSPAYIGPFFKKCIKSRRKTLGIKGCRVECRVVSGYTPGSGPAVAGSDSLPGMGQERLPRRGVVSEPGVSPEPPRPRESRVSGMTRSCSRCYGHG